MKINRWIADFGNSVNQHMINGFYFEMPSSVYEITEKEARGLFADSVDAESLLKELVIKVNIEGRDRFFKVGEKAKRDVMGNDHIYKLHDKTESITVLATWLAAAAYFYTIHQEISETKEDVIEVDYFLTFIPIWLVKRANKFSDMLNKMSDRFKKEHQVELITPNFERVLKVVVKESRARIEGENARHALSRNLDLSLREDAKRYEDAIVVINDLGGQSQDLTKLGKGLRKPGSSADFESFTDISFLKTLEQLRTSKLMTHFTDVRTLEEFVINHVSSRTFIHQDPVTFEKTDFTEQINHTLSEFAKVTTGKALKTFSFPHGTEVVYVYIGGVAQVLKPYILDYLSEKLDSEKVVRNHVFPEDSRKLNIYSGEIVAKDELEKMGMLNNASESEKTTV